VKAVSGKDLCKILGKNGWTHDRTSGSHRIYVKPGFDPVSVPVHGNRTLGAGLQRRLMKQTGLTDADL
jgi:predicted RNA binding protein YcfA (HicA-like mRNA interferase family)